MVDRYRSAVCLWRDVAEQRVSGLRADSSSATSTARRRRVARGISVRIGPADSDSSTPARHARVAREHVKDTLLSYPVRLTWLRFVWGAVSNAAVSSGDHTLLQRQYLRQWRMDHRSKRRRNWSVEGTEERTGTSSNRQSGLSLG